jgi:hypothetical protein
MVTYSKKHGGWIGETRYRNFWVSYKFPSNHLSQVLNFKRYEQTYPYTPVTWLAIEYRFKR